MTARPLTGATFCSGIGAPEVAAPGIDWRLACDVAAFPRAVLQQRFGYVLPSEKQTALGLPVLLSDMADISAEAWPRHGLPWPDIIVAGTPCQAFSIGGDRGGLTDPRGNLTLKYVEILHGIQDAAPGHRFVALWENVPGVLSMRDNAFGCLLGAIVGGSAAVPPPERSGRPLSWPRAGMVSGPRGRAAWRVLDAQHFGCAAPRARVFLAFCPGGGADPAALLFESEGGGRDDPARPAPPLAACLTARGAQSHDDRETFVVEGSGGIRRLTPTEWERIMGFPDGHTAIPCRGRPAADGPRYAALGNSQAVPVMRWLLARCAAALTWSARGNP